MTSLPAPKLRTPALFARARHLLIAAAALAAAAAAVFAFIGGSPSSSGPAPATEVLKHYGQLPLRFEVNRGQAARGIDYVARGAGSTLAISAASARLALPAASDAKARPAVVQMRFVGADPHAEAEAGRRLAGVSNYLLGNDPRRWRTGVPGYASVTYAGAYPGIDLVYHGRQATLEYDFVVAPRADAAVVALRFGGVDSMRIDRRGDLLLGTPAGIVRQHAPVAYQRGPGGAREPVDARYVRHAGDRIGFALGAYDRDRALVIDPVLSYATFLATNSTENANAVAVDAAGSAYVVGTTNAAGTAPFPTQGPFQGANAGGPNDAFVTKLSPSGTQLEYSTYLGGNGADVPRGIAVEGTNAYVTGDTTSAAPTSFPTTAGAYQATKSGASSVTDAFVTKLSSTGAALDYSTYLGGALADAGRGVAVAGGVAVVTGSTASSGSTAPAFPTANAVQGAYGGGNADAFVTRLNATGTALDASTFLGGTAAEQGNAIALGGGKAYVAGQTASTNFPTATPIQAANGGGSATTTNDAFVTRFNTTTTALEYSTYLGGIDADNAAGIAVASDNAYVAGDTTSGNFPTTGPLQANRAGETDAFVTKLSSTGTALVYSTYLGGRSSDNANSIALDGTNAIVAGSTASASFPTTLPVAEKSGNGDAFLAKLSSTGGSLAYSTFLGGNASESGSVAAVDGAGNAYIAGSSTFFANDDMPTRNAFQPQPGLGSDAFVAKIAPTPTSPLVTRVRPHGGSTAGGTTVVIRGAGLSGATAVRFGQTPAASFTVDSASRITAVSPPGTGKVTVTVTVSSTTTPANPAGDYSYGEGEWEPAGSLNVARYVHTMSLLDSGAVLIAGGRASQGGAALSSAELYDPLTNDWTPTGSMSDIRFGHTATLLDGPACSAASPPSHCGKVLVTGGFAGQTGSNAQPVQSSAELYDPQSGTWSATSSMGTRRALHAAALLPNGKVLVAGGRACGVAPPATCDFNTTSNTAEVYDPATAAWTPTANTMASARHTTAAAVLADGKVLVPAGFPGEQRSADLYDPATNSWSAADDLTVARARQGATLLADGRVLVAGGFPSNDSAEVYDPVTNEFTLTGSLTSFGRFNAYFAPLSNGRILFAGGGNGGLTAEIFNPVTNTWRRAAAAGIARGSSSSNANSQDAVALSGGPSACASRCGKVLVAGNTDDTEAELYVPEALPVISPPPTTPPPPSSSGADTTPPPAAVTPPPPPAASPAADTTKPSVTGLSVVPDVFAVKPPAGAGAAAAKGTSLRYRLSEPARVTFTIERVTIGRRVGGTCRRLSPANRSMLRCTRYFRAGRLTQSGKAGANRRAFSGRIGGRALPRGPYRLTATARDSAGNASKRKTDRFRIVR